MSIEIYYFSGTGNSLHAARELQSRLTGAELIPITRLLQDRVIRSHAEVVGLVFPNFCLTIPIPVKEFLTRGDFSSTRYMFAVCTRGGSPSQAFDFINELLKKQGRKLDAALNVTMPWNHPVGTENLAGGRPRWNLARRSYACFACINFCPKHSIQVLSRFPVNSATPVNGRYHHPDVTWSDIAAQLSDGIKSKVGEIK